MSFDIQECIYMCSWGILQQACASEIICMCDLWF